MPDPTGAAPIEGPLAGITVVALEQAVSAPMCTRVLGDLGARVIKVEHPAGGDFARYYDDVVKGSAAHFVWCNRGKESIALDVKAPAGQEVLHRLLAGADALVANLAPGALDGMGLGEKALAERHPHLVTVMIDGYGPGGPLSHKRAYDLLIQAEAGACMVTGEPGHPAKAGPPVADVTTGLHAAITVLALLRDRDRRGGPARQAQVSLFDVMTDVMGYALTWTQHTGIDQEPRGVGSPAVSPYGAYPTTDGDVGVRGTTHDAEWQRLSRDVIRREDLAQDERLRSNAGRVAHRDLVDAAIAEWTGRHDLATVQAAADAAGIGNSRLNRPSEVVAHPHLAARHRWHRLQTPGGAVDTLLPPPVISDYTAPMGPVPALGEHTERVLAGIDCTAEDVAALRAAGVLGRPRA